MPPNNTHTAELPIEQILKRKELKTEYTYETLWGTFQQPIKWPNAIALCLIHVWMLYIILTFPYFHNISLPLFNTAVGIFGGLGITAGAHRLWTHKSYRAKLPLRMILLAAYATAGHNKLYEWVRDHRVHHKFSETDADPHNANRGFFFSHVGWLMMKKHPDVITKGKLVDCKDILEDSVVRFFERYFWQMQLIFCFGLPIAIPYYLFGESFYYSFVASIARYVIVLNATWSVNSFAHLYGNKPYDKNIQPAENKFVSIAALGEGWHNYHHTFPWDYKTSEFGSHYNLTAQILDFFGLIGWAYDFKTASAELILKTVKNYGDGTHENIDSR